MPTPNTATTANSVRPTRRRIGRIAINAVEGDGTDAGRGAQPAVADVADAEAVLGDRRQQRDGTAEEHGEEIEGDGAEQDRTAADEAEALEGVVEGGPLVGWRAVLALAQAQGGDGDRREAEADLPTRGTAPWGRRRRGSRCWPGR